MKRFGCTVLLLLGGVFAFFLLSLAPHLLGPPILLLFGWVPALGRFVRAWHAGPGAVALFALATLVLVAGGHRFLRWLAAGLKKAEGSDGTAPGRWRWRWTACGFGLAFCALVAVVCVVLTVHQLHWMSKSSEPWFVNLTARRLTWLRAAHDLELVAQTNHWDSGKTRAAFWKMASYGADMPDWESLETVWVEKDAQTLRAIVLVPRDLGQRSVGRFTLLQPGMNHTMQSLEALPAVLASFGLSPPELKPEPRTPLLP